MDKQLLKLLRKKRKEIYSDPKSILKKFDAFMEENGIYHSLNQEIFFKSIENKQFLCAKTLSLFFEANYDNEKEFLIDCLLHMGYDRNLLVELVLDIFRTRGSVEYLWHYADFLYSLKNYGYMDDYLKIITDKRYGTSREMLILLVGESKKDFVIPCLMNLAADDEVVGHVLVALSYFSNKQIYQLMTGFVDYPIKWISDVANTYVNNIKN